MPTVVMEDPDDVISIGNTVLRSISGSVIPLLFDRWTALPSVAEMAVLDRAVEPVLDVGCGPGRHVTELAARGLLALGIDVSSDAVALAERRGSIVLQRSVFERLPNEGRWRTALLLDGNIGIGGDAASLLCRLRDVMAPHGAVLVEVESPESTTSVETVRVESMGATGPWFKWARVSIDDVDGIAGQARFERTWTCEEEGRWFVQLTS